MMDKFNSLLDGVRDLIKDTKPDVIVDLNEPISFTQTFESMVRDANKKGKVYSYFQHNHIEQGTPVWSELGSCNCIQDGTQVDRYKKTFWEGDSSVNYDALYYDQYKNELDENYVDIGESIDGFVRGWNTYLNNPFEFDIIHLNSQLYWSDIEQILVKNKFINNQLKGGSIAIFEGGGDRHPRIKLNERENNLSEFSVEPLRKTTVVNTKYSMCEVKYVG